MDEHPNEWYLNNLLEGNPQAIQSIQRSCYPGISRFIRNHGGTEQDAEDIYMDGLTAIFTKLKEGEVTLTCKFSVFLFQICKNLWYKKTRRKKFQDDTPLDDLDARHVTEDWIPVMEKTARLSLLQEKFLKLSQKCRELLTMAWHSELNLQQISEKLDIAYSALRKRKFDCQQRLSEWIRADARFEELK